MVEILLLIIIFCLVKGFNDTQENQSKIMKKLNELEKKRKELEK